MNHRSVPSTIFAVTLSAFIASAYAGEWSGTMSCGELQNAPSVKSREPFVGSVILRIDGNAAVLDRTGRNARERLEGTVVRGRPIQLLGSGWMIGNEKISWKVRAELIELGPRFEGTAVAESHDSKTKYRDCTVSLNAKVDESSLSADTPSRPSTVGKTEKVQAKRPKTEELVPLPPFARVVDQTSTLSETQRGALETKLTTIDRNGDREVVIVIVDSTKPEDIQRYAKRLGDVWKVGSRNAGRGILIVVAKDDRRARIEVSSQLATAVSDATAKETIDKYLIPAFRGGDFAGGLNSAVDQLSGLEQQSAVAVSAPPMASKTSGLPLSTPVSVTAEENPALQASQSASSSSVPTGVSGPANNSADYRVIALHAPTHDELDVIKKSEAKKFLDEGGRVTTAGVDLDQDGIAEIVTVAQSSAWCGSDGCASMILKTDAAGGITSFDNDCMNFGGSEKIGVGNATNGLFAALYPLDDNGQIEVTDRNDLTSIGKPIVCKITASTSATVLTSLPEEAAASNVLSAPASIPDNAPDVGSFGIGTVLLSGLAGAVIAALAFLGYRRIRQLFSRGQRQATDVSRYLSPSVAVGNESVESRETNLPDVSKETVKLNPSAFENLKENSNIKALTSKKDQLTSEGLLKALGSVVTLMFAGYAAYQFIQFLPAFSNPAALSSALEKVSGSALNSSAKDLYKFWQVSNPSEPGVYNDELVDGKILFECNAEGKYPAKFGVLRIKTTFDLISVKDSKPFLVYVGGIDYGTKLIAFGAQPPQTGGAAIIVRLRLAGCNIPADLGDRSKAALSEFAEK